jgi:hypothetical protein
MVPLTEARVNALYYGDNLTVLRNEIERESVDLIYLDPPFNSQANYNVLFKTPTGQRSHAQIEAFEDTWHWGDESERAFDEVLHCWNTDAAELLRALRAFLKENDMMAYLAMMAVPYRKIDLLCWEHEPARKDGRTARKRQRAQGDSQYPGPAHEGEFWRCSPAVLAKASRLQPSSTIVLFPPRL